MGHALVRQRHLKIKAHRSASALAIITATALSAGTAWAQAPAAPAGVEEVVVTGSRVVRDGFQAPTPLTVIGTQELESQPRHDLAETINLLPAFANNFRPQQSTVSLSSGLTGVNALNLRGMGVNRTLPLLDGHRSVGTDANGVIDISEFPQELVSRVEVVTGGASAGYGSDAITGVVNFILDKTYTGLKGEVSGGITSRGDNKGYKVSLTGGTGFAGGRGHLLLSGEMAAKDDLQGDQRAFMTEGRLTIQNPAYTATSGLPQFLFTDRVGPSRFIPGGLIVDTALRGTAFGQGGTPYQFVYGTGLPTAAYMSGGNWEFVRSQRIGTIDPKLNRRSIFGRVSYDISDNLQVYGQASYARSMSESNAGWALPANTFAIQQDNAFIPAEVRARMVALAIPRFTISSMRTDLVLPDNDALMVTSHNVRQTRRFLVGLEGQFDALGSPWQWEAFAQRGVAKTSETALNNVNTGNYARAIDAVRNPAGTIVCRSTLTNPTDGCVPYNPMGIGVNSASAIDYVVDNTNRSQRFVQDNVGASFSGSPFSLWAGEVSVAFGGEWRREESSGSAPVSGYFSANNFPTFGKYTVTEGFVETVVPLLRDAPLAELVELNAAGRLTHYSNSGSVETWKVGATWRVNGQVMFRGTVSRDIRAPNLAELFAGGTSGSGSGTIDPFRNNAVVSAPTRVTGNPNLDPERALTTGFGVVVQPAFVPGLIGSVDYWNIDLKDGIGTLGGQQILDQCFATRDSSLCQAIARNAANEITLIRLQPFNLATQIRRGVDFELGYRLPLSNVGDGWGGDVTARLFATHYLKAYTNNGVTAASDVVGEHRAGGVPEWQYNASITYAADRFSLNLTASGFDGGTINNTWVECTTGCPAATSLAPTINVNHAPGGIYFSLSTTYDFTENVTAFLSIQNLADKQPEPIPDLSNFATPAQSPSNPALWDHLGRAFRVGIRFKM